MKEELETAACASPQVTRMRIIPVAGYDSMLLNLSGAHAPCFTRNVVLINDSAGQTGVGEVPGGESIREVLERAVPLVIGVKTGDVERLKNLVLETFAGLDAAGRG